MATLATAMAKLAAALVPREKVYAIASAIATSQQTYIDTDKAVPPQEADLSDAVQATVDELEGFLSVDRLKALLTPALQVCAKSDEIASDETDPNAIIDLLNAYLYTSSKSVKTRSCTRGAASTGIGNGFFHRVTVNQYGGDLEASYPETRTFLVTGDQNTGAEAPGKEVVLITGARFDGQINRATSGTGSGFSDTRTAVTSADSIAANSSFSSVSGTDSVPSTLSSWTLSNSLGDGTDWTITRTKYYLASADEGDSPGAVFWTKTSACTFSQTIASVGTIKDGTPYHVGVAACVDDAACASWIGTVAIFIGGTTATFPLCGATLTATPGGAGNVNVGDHYIGVALYDNATGIEGPICAAVKVTISSTAKTIALTAIPTLTGYYRKVYVTKADTVTSFTLGSTASKFFLLSTIADDSTTTGTYNTADGSLSATHPTQVCAAENRTTTARYVYLSLPASKSLYPANWTIASATLGFTVTRSSGTGIYLDAFRSLPYQAFDGNTPKTGQWGLLMGGPTPWLKGNTWTVADSVGATAIIQEDLHLAFGQTLLASGSPTYSDPSI